MNVQKGIALPQIGNIPNDYQQVNSKEYLPLIKMNKILINLKT
jgi:hypothetical protein